MSNSTRITANLNWKRTASGYTASVVFDEDARKRGLRVDLDSVPMGVSRISQGENRLDFHADFGSEISVKDTVSFIASK